MISPRNNRTTEDLPLAYVSSDGTIVGYNDAFTRMSGRTGEDLTKVSLTALAKFNSPTGLLEAAYKLDQLGADGKGFWRASLGEGPIGNSNEKNISRKASGYSNNHKEEQKDAGSKIEDNAAASTVAAAMEDYEIIARASSMRINGKPVLEATIQLMSHSKGLNSKSASSAEATKRQANKPELDEANLLREAFQSASFNTHTVLIVDDSTTALKVMARLISNLGHDVSTAINGLEALEKLKGFDFDIVLMDINMPLMNGLEASYAFRQIERERKGRDEPHQKIIAMSADVSTSLFHQCTNAGFDAFVPKPLTKQRFLDVLRFLASDNNILPESV